MADLDRIPEIRAALPAAVAEAQVAGAELVKEAAEARVPVRTGRLRDAIHLDEQPEGVYVVAGDREAWYGMLVEHGTVYAAPHPFLVPALEEMAAKVEAGIAEAIRRTVEGR